MAQNPTKLTVLLFDAFSNHCLANLIEPLRAVNSLSRKRLYEWQLVTLDGKPVTSSSGIQVTPDGPIASRTGDMLAVMPSYDVDRFDTFDTTRALQAAARRHKLLIGLDTGPWLLARAGLLDGHQATIHWQEHSRFEEAFPEVDITRARYVMSRDRLTCSGAMAAFDLMSALITQDHGPLLAMEVGHYFLTPGADNARVDAPRGSSRTVKKAIDIMQANIETPLSIPALAKQIGCSQKVLEVSMRSDLQISPLGLYRKLRLNLARKLASESDISIAEVAARCGYENPSALTRAFRAEFGVAPRRLRARV